MLRKTDPERKEKKKAKKEKKEKKKKKKNKETPEEKEERRRKKRLDREREIKAATAGGEVLELAPFPPFQGISVALPTPGKDKEASPVDRSVSPEAYLNLDLKDHEKEF